jgi:hypothetical protein
MSGNLGSGLSADRPFPGLRPFDFADHDFFFGREDQSYALFRRLDRSRFLAVVGSSGSGKSSLVRAGLLPLLKAESQDTGGRYWRWKTFTPGDRPLARLAERLASMSRAADSPAIDAARRERIAFALRRSSFGLDEALAEIEGLGERSLLLVVDQFEELFRYIGTGAVQGGDARAREEAAHFVQLLLEASCSPGLRVHVLITMRSDFIGDCSRFLGLPEAVSETQFLVPALTRRQREEVIRGPIERGGAAIEPPLVERLLNDASDELDQLPVLQHCLLRLWERAGRDRTANAVRRLGLGHYRDIGGMAHALSWHADEILADLVGRKLAVEQVFRALSEVDKDGRATRRALPFAQLVAETGVSEDAVRGVLDRFRAEDCSFIVPTVSAVRKLEAEARIDVGHEALLRQWERISAAAREDIDGGRSAGWLWAEDADGQRYRALASFIGRCYDSAPRPDRHILGMVEPTPAERGLGRALWRKARARPAAAGGQPGCTRNRTAKARGRGAG